MINSRQIIPLTLFLITIAHAAIASPCAKTQTEQDAWVHRSVDVLIAKAHAAYEEESAERVYLKVLAHIAGTLKQCKLTDDLSFTSRYPEFVEYIRVLSLDQKPDHQLGFEVSDRVYFQQTRQFVSIPDFLLKPELLEAVRHFETLGKAKEILRELNSNRAKDEQLLFFSFESRHLGTPDNDDSYKRLLIVVPGNPAQNIPEKWVQFGIADPHARVPVRNMSVVAVVHGPDNTSNTYFKDYFRTYRSNRPVTVTGRWELGEGDDNCIKCHKSGVLPIFPVDGSVSEDEKAIVNLVNKRFLNYVAPRFGGYIDPSKFGPGLGSAHTILNQSRTASNTNCSSCHQPSGLGSLNWPMDSVLISSFVEGGQMPLGSHLKALESTQLYEQLINDYFSIDPKQPGILKGWLLHYSGR